HRYLSSYLDLYASHISLHPLPSRRSSDLLTQAQKLSSAIKYAEAIRRYGHLEADIYAVGGWDERTNLLYPDTYDVTDEDLSQIRSEEHTSELQSRFDLVCRLLLEKKQNLC